MKKIIALILALVMVLGMVGCGSSKKEPEATATPKPVATAKPTEKPKMTRSEAVNKLENYLNQNSNTISSTLASKAYVSSARSISVSTIEDGCGMLYDQTDDYGFTMKGRFFGYDSYGNLKGIWSFSWAAVVEKNGRVRLANNPSVFKS